jgi:Protein of unknown function (DUF998)
MPATGTGIPRKPLTRALLRAGTVAGPLFVATFLVDGTTRRDYRAQRHPVSSLALGPRGWVQTANFALTGALYLGYSMGLRRAGSVSGSTSAGPILVGAAAVGLLGSAAFVTDPVSGYPPGTPDMPAASTARGRLHDGFAIPTFLGLPAAALVFARGAHRDGDRRWAAYCAGSGLGMLAAFAGATAGFTQAPSLVDRAGLLQRAAVITGFGWLTALAVRTLRAVAGSDRDDASTTRCRRPV